MSKFIHKNHNVSVLMYHIVCPTKYRRGVFVATVDAKVKEICVDIQKRYEIEFLEIGTDDDHVHFLVQSVPLHESETTCANNQKPARHEKFSKAARKLKNTYGAASSGRLAISSAQLAHTVRKK